MVGRKLAPTPQQRGQFVAELASYRAQPQAQDVLQIRLQREARESDAIELEFLDDAAAELLGAARENVNLGVGVGQLAHQRGRAGNGPFLIGALECRAQEIANRVEVRTQIRLVEVPTSDEHARRRYG